MELKGRITKKQRIKIWKRVLKMLKRNNKPSVGICIILHSIVCFDDYHRYVNKKVSSDIITLVVEEWIYYFPELLKYKPSYAQLGDYWWSFNSDSYRKRVDVVEQIIEDLEE